MYVITVIPLTRGVSADALSYFSSEKYSEGSLVTVPIRNTTALGLVVGYTEVSAAKTALRAATFSLKKLPVQKDVPFLGSAYIETAREVSTLCAAPMGSILYNLLPPEIRTGEVRIPHTHHVDAIEKNAPQTLIAHTEERYRAYRSLVRETFAHSGSVLITVPSSIDAEKVMRALEHGIADRVIMLTSTMTKSELKRAYESLEDFSKTKLIIATPSHALLERHDITLVIMENARSAYYKEMVRPYIDYRDVLRIHTKHTGRRLLYADLLLRTEEEAKRREEIYTTFGEVPKRIELPARLEIVDTTRPQDTEQPFTLFSPTVIDAIRETKKKKGRIFLYAARRGLAPLVACSDCGYIFRSKESGSPYSLIRTTRNGTEERWFVCSTSGEKVRAADTCPECGSWRLKERGIGIQQVYDEVHKLFPTIPTVLFDHVSARTFKRALFLKETFYKTKGSILLGTSMALPYLTDSVDLAVVVNMDALLATPTWRLEEENLALLLRLREIASDSVLVQTRTPDAQTLVHAKHGTIEHFYTEELELRKNFNYPPFATFIHLTWQGTSSLVKALESDIRTILEGVEVSYYPHPTPVKDSLIMYGLIRVPAHTWPNTALIEKLRRIPPSVRIVINPDRIV